MKKGYSLLLVGLIVTSLYIVKPQRTHSIDPFFTLTYKSFRGEGLDYGNLLKQQLARIGIDLDVIEQEHSGFLMEVPPFYDYDIIYFKINTLHRPFSIYNLHYDPDFAQLDPDFTGLYSENGTLNYFFYHTSFDWDNDLGTGKNEWYMKEGTQIMPPNSDERIQHYWDWEDYLMDKVCLMMPTFSSKTYVAYWSTLDGYNYSEGLLRSWGKMDWNSAHTGQVNTDELVISNKAWSDLNPLFQDDSSSRLISNACMDPLIWYDEDLSVWPHLASSFNLINETLLRITVREDVMWEADKDGLFLDERFDIKDVYFTLHCWKYVSNDQNDWKWIEKMEIIDDYTLDIFIDGNPTTQENEPYAPVLSKMNALILPEHYLNQTHLADWVTPDISHHSWNSFATHCFGTGLFEINSFTEGLETVLTIRPNCWRLDPTITADPALNWNERFGFGEGWDGMHQLRIRDIPEKLLALFEYEVGKIDVVDVTSFPEKRISFELEPDFEFQSDLASSFGLFGYNMHEDRPVIGNRSPCPGDNTISIGLAIRKAISYAMNRDELNKIVHGQEYVKIDHPIGPKMGIWNNPNIIRYNYDLDKAREYMKKTSFWGGWTPTVSISIFSIFGGIIAVFTATSWIIKVKKKESRKQLK